MGNNAKRTCGAAKAGKWGSYCGGKICLIVVSLMQFQALDFSNIFSIYCKVQYLPIFACQAFDSVGFFTIAHA